MTSVTTNVASLRAQYNLNNINKELEGTMDRLSTGKRINSAGDDAAGVSIVSRMNSQINGLSQAIRNANDGIGLIKTSEGALTEVSNMLQRMRELAVQASNGTNNSADQATLDLEVQQLKVEIDRIASSTQFNSQNVLDGTFKKHLQIGDRDGHVLDLKLGSVKTESLGMGQSGTASSSIVGARITVASDGVTSAAIDEGDIKINGQGVGAIAVDSDMETVLKAINDNVDNVTASAFNVVVAKNVGNGVTTVGQMVITVKELGQTTATAFNISASSNLAELRDNINNETGTVVKASINTDGKLVLSNDTGATITIDDNSSSVGSGFSATSADYGGFIKLEANDTNPIRIEMGNLHAATPGAAADLAGLGFRETTSETDDDAYTVTGIALTDTSTGWGQTDITVNGVAIYDADIATTSFQGRLDALNNFSQETGVVASAFFEKSYDLSAISFLVKDRIHINGTQTSAGASIGVLVANINDDIVGITATRKGDNVILSGSFQEIEIMLTGSAGITASGAQYFGAPADGQSGVAAKVLTQIGGIRLDSTANQPISIELGDGSTVAEHGFLEANVGAADFEVNAATLGLGASSSLSGLSVSSTSNATAAISTLDNAINAVDKMRGDLGSLNNRLDYTVTNLSNVVLNTQSAKSQIEDANFADETTNLIKGQILAQAATSMLAQANQSKQALLALLQ